MFIGIPGELRSAVELAVVRLGYLYPALTFHVENEGIQVEGTLPDDASILRRDALYAVYREKIYADTLEMRSTFLSAVTRR